MKKIQIISFLLFTSILFSCTYDYIMPDYSNAKPQYVLQELPNEVKNEWRNIAIGYGLNLNISQEKWEAAAKENKENQSLQIAVRCLGRYNSFNDEYYEICRFRLTDRNVGISPFPYVIKVNPNENYITELPPVTERAYIYKITDSDIRSLILEIAKSRGYEIADINRGVIEKDKDGNILYQGENSEYHISAKGTQTVEIFFDLIGWPKDNYSKKVKIGTLKINRVFDLTNVADKDYINKKILLSKDMPYTLDFLSDSERIYNLNSNRQCNSVEFIVS